MPERVDIEAVKEELLIASEKEAEALRAYLEQEERIRIANELLERRLRDRMDRGMSFSI